MGVKPQTLLSLFAMDRLTHLRLEDLLEFLWYSFNVLPKKSYELTVLRGLFFEIVIPNQGLLQENAD